MQQAEEVHLHVGVDECGGGGVEEAEGGGQLEYGGELPLQNNLVERVVEDEGLERGVRAQWRENKAAGWNTEGEATGEAGGCGTQQARIFYPSASGCVC